MKFNRLITLALLIAICALSQRAAGEELTPVVYDDIRTIVNDNPQLFNSLTARFQSADTTLTPAEVAIVYYGHAFTPGYNPDEKYEDIAEAYSGDDGNLAITLIDEALRTNPASLPLLFKLYGCCATSDVPRIMARKEGVADRIMMICDMIASTGTGVQNYTPWLVVDERDIDEFLNKYMYIQRELERSDLGSDIKAIKVQLDGIPDPVILYFDLTLPHKYSK